MKFFDRNGVVLVGGEKVEVDIVVLVMGFDNMWIMVRKLVGDKMVDCLKDVWGLDEEGEMNVVSLCLYY